MKSGFHTVIESLGIYLPPTIVTTDEVVQGCRLRPPLPLERMTGIRARRVAGTGQYTIDLVREAVATCLARSKYGPEAIDLLIVCSISKWHGPDDRLTWEPVASIQLKKHFGFSNALTFDVSNACAGMFTAIAIADALLKGGLVRCALIASGEYAGPLVATAQREIARVTDPRVACLTIGDSGAAITLEASAEPGVGFQDIDLYTLGRYSSLCIAKPSDAEGGGGYTMLTDAPRLAAVSVEHGALHAAHVVKRNGWSGGDIPHKIFHQVTTRSLQAANRALNAALGEDVCSGGTAINNLAERGNTATTTHFVALEDNILNDRIKTGDRALFCPAASGLTVGAALYTFDDLPDRRRRWETGYVRNAKPVLGRIRAPADEHPLARIRIESIGTVPRCSGKGTATIESAEVAAQDCLDRSSYERDDLDLLIFTGTYRTGIIAEPAIAAMIAGELHVNDAITSPAGQKTLAFDILNSGVGFLTACSVSSGMIASGKFKNAMIVATEVENNAIDPARPLLGLKETGSAIVLDRSSEDGPGFERFLFESYTEYLDAFRAYTVQEGGRTFFQFDRDPRLDQYYLRCISESVGRLLSSEGLSIRDLRVVCPPQISPRFVRAVGEHLDVRADRLIDVAEEGRDFYSSSVPYALEAVYRRRLAKPGDLGLIIAVGAGIQVGCAVYRF